MQLHTVQNANILYLNLSCDSSSYFPNNSRKNRIHLTEAFVRVGSWKLLMSTTQLAQCSQTIHKAFRGSYFVVASAMNTMCLLFNTLRTVLYRNMSSLSSLPHVPALLINSCTVLHLSMLVIVVLGQSPCRSSQVLFPLPPQCY